MPVSIYTPEAVFDGHFIVTIVLVLTAYTCTRTKCKNNTTRLD